MTDRNDVHTQINDTLGIGTDDYYTDESLHQKITLTSLDEIPPTLRPVSKTKTIHGRGIVYAAAGPETIPKSKLKVMSDPLKPETRRELSECAISEPNISSSIEKRAEAVFADGFDLSLELASIFDPNTGEEFSEEQTTQLLSQIIIKYAKPFARLKTWAKDMNIVDLMRDAEAVSFVQGRNATMMLPGVMDLKPNTLPVMVETIFADDLKEVIVDIGLTRRIVAVKTNLQGKKFCRADEMVYLVRGSKKALRREGKFYGLPQIGPIIIILKIIKRIYNLDMSEAVTAAYVTKLLFQVQADGNEKGLKERIEKLLSEYAKRGKRAFATFDEIKDIKPVAVKVDWAMLDGIESKLVHLVLAITGVPSSMANREQNLNRDLAMVQAIQFIKFVRDVSEKTIGNAFASQMFTPLLAHLAGQTVADLPVRVKITRTKPDKDLNEIWADNLMNEKQKEMNSPDGTLNKSPIQTNVFSASGPDGIIVTPNGDGSYAVKPDT